MSGGSPLGEDLNATSEEDFSKSNRCRFELDLGDDFLRSPLIVDKKSLCTFKIGESEAWTRGGDTTRGRESRSVQEGGSSSMSLLGDRLRIDSALSVRMGEGREASVGMLTSDPKAYRLPGGVVTRGKATVEESLGLRNRAGDNEDLAGE